MANRRRARQIAAPYKRFVGTGVVEPETGGEPDQASGQAASSSGYEIKLLSRGRPSRSKKESSQIFFETAILPLEIMSYIASMLDDPRPLMMVCKAFYLAALPHIYRAPGLTAQNYAQFCETVNANKMLGHFVRCLDLAMITQSGRSSSTAKLLKRCSSGLEQFRASQTQFGLGPLLILRSCYRLRVLDLSLISSSVDLPELFPAIENLKELEVIKFPRCSIKCQRHDLKWPPNLRTLELAGGINADFIQHCEFPKTIRRIKLSNCPQIGAEAINNLLIRLGPQLVSFAAEYPLPHVPPNGLDNVLQLCPNLRSLRLSIDYFTSDLLEDELIPPNCQLRRFDIVSSGMMGHSDKVKPGDLYMFAACCETLQIVQISLQLGWSTKTNDDIGEIARILEDRDGGFYMI